LFFVFYFFLSLLFSLIILFKENKKFSIQFAGRPLTIEVGDICGFANGSCLVRYGDTVIMANAVASKEPRQGIDFFPLSVDFEEKLWCGLTPYEEPLSDSECWSESFGYSCCKGCRVYETDAKGSGGVEGHQWCGIPSYCQK